MHFEVLFTFPVCLLSRFAADVFRRRSSAVQVRGDQMAVLKYKTTNH
jgi:hypothetical protein